MEIGERGAYCCTNLDLIAARVREIDIRCVSVSRVGNWVFYFLTFWGGGGGRMGGGEERI